MKYNIIVLYIIISISILLLIYNYIYFKISYNNLWIEYFLDERTENMLKLFEMCATKYNDNKIKEIKFDQFDRGLKDNKVKKYYTMCYDKTDPELESYCGPDWTFINWPSASIYSFEEETKKITKAGDTEPKLNKIGWYGSIVSPMPDVVEHKTRPLLKKIGDENSIIFDIVNIVPESNGKIDNNIKQYISLEELVKKYKFLLDIGGNGYSGRLKYLLYSKRPLLYVDRRYIEYFSNDLKPYEHYIPVREDLSDLLEQAKWMFDNYEESIKIANNAYEFATSNFTKDKILDRIYYVYKNINN